jgi:hypothetical protein
MDVSIIIVSWNTRAVLKNCLDSIYQKTRGVSFEVIVIDNASVDRSAEMVKREFPGAILIENCQNRGFAAANNQGMAVATGRYILLLNSDTLVMDQTITETVFFADYNPEAAVVGCRVLNKDGTLQPSCFMFPSIGNMLLSSSYLYKLFHRSHFFGREGMTWWDRDDMREVDVVTGCFMLARSEAIRQVGVMDERFFMYGEETDWCYRFKKAGWKILFTPAVEIVHLGGQSSRYVSDKMIVQLRLSILQFIEKHHGWLTYKLACFFTALFFAVRVPMWLMVSVFASERRGQAGIKLRAYFSGIVQVLSVFSSGLAREGSV